MNTDEIAFNLLANRICENCNSHKDLTKKMCLRYWGESVGWQWHDMEKEGTCIDWV